MKHDFFKAILENLSDYQVVAASKIISKYYNPTENIYKGPPEPQYGKMPESRYDRDRRFEKSGCIEVLKLQPGHQYVMIDDSPGTILTYIGLTTPKTLLTSKSRYLFLKPDSSELIFNGFDFERYLPMIPLHMITIVEKDGT